MTYLFAIGNGLGMKVLGGKEIPGSKGRVCGFVSKILPSGVADNLREVRVVLYRSRYIYIS